MLSDYVTKQIECPTDPDLFEFKNGLRFVKFDEILIKLEKKQTVIEYYYKNKLISTKSVSQMDVGSTLFLSNGMEGLIRVEVHPALEPPPPPKPKISFTVNISE